MSRIIVFAGGCHSGKTTSARALGAHLQKLGFTVKYPELSMRNLTMGLSIDALRNNPSEYLNAEKQYIEARLRLENEALEDTSSTIYISDRTIFDTLFYLNTYIDTTRLSETELDLFYDLSEKVRSFAALNAAKYYRVVLCYPIEPPINFDDKFRPRHLKRASEFEFNGIKDLVFSYCYLHANMYVKNELDTDFIGLITNSLYL